YLPSFIILFLIMMESCCYDNLLASDLDLNPQLTEKMVQNISLNSGIRTDSLDLKDKSIWKYAISIPEIDNNSRVPLVIALHWDVEGGGEYEPYLRCQAAPGLEKLKAIIFAPDAGNYNFWDVENYSLIITLIDYAKKYWPIEADKIVVTGYSNGGYGAWFFGVNYPFLFSAAIPVGSRIEYDKKSVITDKKLKIPSYVIHSKDDSRFIFENIEQKVKELEQKGSDIQLHVVEGLSHTDACAYSIHLPSAADWLLNEVW
ncbi:dienelactone hydrolase family protein, partial [Candidatus Neomarinimicrobiota bacterium]